MRSWHDFHITGYAVHGKRQEICFDLEWPYDTPTDVKLARLHFQGVEAYFLEHDLGGSIVSSIDERPLRGFLEEWAEKFETECKWGWPKFWRPKPYPARQLAVELEESFQRLTDIGIKCIEISSSYGLSGWVLATETRQEIIAS